MLCRVLPIAFCAVFLAFVCGCSSLSTDRGWIGNTRALSSTPTSPAKGENDARAYINPAYLEASFGVVKVVTPTLLLSPRRMGEEKYLKSLAIEVTESAKAALRLIERFEGVQGGSEASAQTELEIEGWVHLHSDESNVFADPLYGEYVSRLVVIYTLRDLSNGEIIAKYTANLPSQWEHPQRVHEELLEKAVEAADELGFMLSNI